MKQELGRYMSWSAELFLRKNLELLDTNMAEFYNKANQSLSDKDYIGELTKFFYSQGIDPLLQMNTVPRNYLGGDYSRYIDPIPNLIPFNIKSIKEEAFKELWWESINIPSNVYKIGIAAFKDAYSNRIVLNEGLKEIGNAAFMYCTSLEEIEIPDSVETLGYNCFSFSGLKRLYIGSGVKELYNNQFDSCFDLEYVTYNGTIEQLKLLADDGRLFPRFFPNCTKLKTIKCKNGDYELVEKY